MTGHEVFGVLRNPSATVTIEIVGGQEFGPRAPANSTLREEILCERDLLIIKYQFMYTVVVFIE